jgi:hypothetical protein
MSESPPHDWFRPRLVALVAEARQAGFAQDVSVAVITDLMNGDLFTVAAPAPDEDWNRDIGEPDGAVNQTIGNTLPTADDGSMMQMPDMTHTRAQHPGSVRRGRF